MSKFIFIGDIHGRVEMVEKALAMEGQKIFVGDFMDSWKRPVKDMEQCLKLVLGAIEKDDSKAIFGNHELSYLMPGIHRCSGYSGHNHMMIRIWESNIWKSFKSHIWIPPNILITHAGLTNEIYQDFNLTLENLDQTLSNWWKDLKSPAHWIGRSRGGKDGVGGIFWCDFNQEFRPIPGLIQIFGHTRGKGIRRIEDSYCIDCLEDGCDDLFEMEINDEP